MNITDLILEPLLAGVGFAVVGLTQARKLETDTNPRTRSASRLRGWGFSLLALLNVITVSSFMRREGFSPIPLIIEGVAIVISLVAIVGLVRSAKRPKNALNT